MRYCFYLLVCLLFVITSSDLWCNDAFTFVDQMKWWITEKKKGEKICRLQIVLSESWRALIRLTFLWAHKNFRKSLITYKPETDLTRKVTQIICINHILGHMFSEKRRGQTMINIVYGRECVSICMPFVHTPWTANTEQAGERRRWKKTAVRRLLCNSARGCSVRHNSPKSTQCNSNCRKCQCGKIFNEKWFKVN